jgi:hypothetical protein
MRSFLSRAPSSAVCDRRGSISSRSWVRETERVQGQPLRAARLFPSEAHAGWFQGKVEALRTGARGGHDPNLTLNDDPNHNTVDLAALENHGPDSAIAWRKLWWVWQKMDDSYGPTWYARWLWIRNTHWGATPEKALTWTDVVEDMSIAVGEDLFPFFRAVGTTLDREQLGRVVFLGDPLSLPTADIELTDAGEARLEPIGDYRAPWR